MYRLRQLTNNPTTQPPNKAKTMQLANVTTPKQTSELDMLCAKLVEAKENERTATAARKSIEDQLAKLMPNRHEGVNSIEGDFFKLSITESVSRKVVEPVALASEIAPAIFDKVIRVKYEINTRNLRAVEEFQPDVYKAICKHIETTPRRASIKAEAIGA